MALNLSQSSPEDRAASQALVFEGLREAAEWALQLLDGTFLAAENLFTALQAMPLAERSGLLLGLVNLPGRIGVECPDVATLKVRLREATTFSPETTGGL